MADGLGTAGGIMQGIAPALGAIPVVGNIASAAFTIGGGLMQNAAAKKQAEQAERTRKEAAGLKPRDIQSEYYKKLKADQMAAVSGLSGLELGQQKLDQATAANLRNIREGSASGAQTLAALSSAIGQQNSAQNALTALDLEYRADMRNQVGEDLGMIGGRKDIQQGITDQKQREMLQMAAALENASTVNKQQAATQMLGAASSTFSSLMNQAPALGEMGIEQRMYAINKKQNLGEELSDSDLKFLKSHGYSLDDINKLSPQSNTPSGVESGIGSSGQTNRKQMGYW